jgi:hypothetical protein
MQTALRIEVEILFSDFSSLKRLQRKACQPFRLERPPKRFAG